MPSLHPSPRRPPSVAATRARSIRRVTVVVTAVLVLFLWFTLSPASDPGDGDVSKADRVREALRNRLPIVPHVGGSKSILRKPSDDQGEGSWTCDRCLVDQPLCDLYGTRNIDLSRAFDGTGGRVRRVLKKALAGDHIKTAVLGGSISQGHGCECTVWHEQVSEWFKKTFPGASHEHTDGSVGARGSDYFKFCHKEHIDTDVDLVLIEMSVNDFRMGDAAFEDFETLLRAVLSYPSHPAVIILQTFKIDGIIATGGDSQLSLAQYYDVPVISARNWLLPMLMKDEKKIPAFFNYYVYTWDTHELIQGQRDLVHPNANGHKSLADMVNLYLDQQLCYLRNKRPEVAPSVLSHIPQAADHYITSLPRMRLNRNFETDVFEGKYDPSCQSLDSRNGKLNVIEAETKGFELWTMPNSNGEKIFWRGTKAGDVITFELELATGEINAYYLKSSKWNNGNVECWLDNNKDKKGERLMGWWDNTQSVGSYQRIFSDPSIKPGTHKLHCEIIDWTDNPDKTAHSFYFIGLFSV